jgi:hypothetical protein
VTDVRTIPAQRRQRFLHALQRTTTDNAIGYAMHSSRSHDAVINVFDAVGNVIETHEQGRFQRAVNQRKITVQAPPLIPKPAGGKGRAFLHVNGDIITPASF